MRHISLVIALLIVCSHGLSSQEPTPAKPGVALDTVRVKATRTRRSYAATSTRTATRTDTPLRDTPQSATVLTRALMADQAMQSMADVARYIPGVAMSQGEGHRDQPTIRGNSSTADFFVDGVRDDAQYLRDLYNVERVEALKGSNAMVFGRGGGGGIINRVSKEASWAPLGTVGIEGGSFSHRRATLDVGQPFGSTLAIRLNGMVENSGGFRDAAGMRRHGVNPTATVLAGSGTVIKLGYEHFADDRTVDRGIPSFRDGPSPAELSTFFGDPAESRSHALVDGAGATIERLIGGGLTVRNHTSWTRYDKFYQNVFAGGAVDTSGVQVNLAGYNNATTRAGLFNRSDVTGTFTAGGVGHTLLVGAEVSRQATDNLRNTGYFGDGTATTLAVPFAQPTATTGVVFRQSGSDADNHVVAGVGALYVQDQIALSSTWQAIVGLRVDRFSLRFTNNRTGQALSRDDKLVSPRAGLIFKPVEALSLYGSFGVSHLPSSGDQFSSLTATTQTLAPERFRNYEVGAKWDVVPSLSLASALFRLDRTNSSAPDPVNPGAIVQTGAQRSTGLELGATGDATGAWQIAGGYSVQRAVIVSTTSSATAGRSAPLVPHHTLSLWNRYQLTADVGVGLGVVHQAAMYAAIDNSVTLPGFTRVDGALFLGVLPRARIQLNLENLLNRRYYATAQGNNNIMPGAPRTLRASLSSGL